MTTTTVACVVPVFLVGGLAVQIGAELDFSPAGLGLATAIYFGTSALTTVPAGRLVERYGATATARGGVLLSATCLLAIGLLARNFPILVGLLGASAAANGLGQLSSNTFLAAVPARRQGLSFGIKQAAIPIATLVAGLSVPAVALTLGWRWAFVIAAVAAAGAVALVPRDAGRPAPRTRSSRSEGERATTGLVVMGMAMGLGSATAGAMGIFLVDSAVSRGLAPGTAGLTLTLGSIACVTARILGGWFFDRRGAHGDVLAVALLLAVGAVGLSLLAVPGLVALAAGVLLGFGFGWAFPGLVNVAVVQLHPHAPAAATAITQTGLFTGACLGPLAFGLVAAEFGYPTGWLGAAVGMLLAAALTLVARRLFHPHRQRLTGNG